MAERVYWADLTYSYKVGSDQPLTEQDIEEIVLALWEGGESTDTDGNTVWVKLETTEFNCEKPEE